MFVTISCSNFIRLPSRDHIPKEVSVGFVFSICMLSYPFRICWCIWLIFTRGCFNFRSWCFCCLTVLNLLLLIVRTTPSMKVVIIHISGKQPISSVSIKYLLCTNSQLSYSLGFSCRALTGHIPFQSTFISGAPLGGLLL